MNGFGDVASQLGRGFIRQSSAIGDHADLTARLNGERLLDTGETIGQGLKFFEPSDILLQRFPAGTRASESDPNRENDPAYIVRLIGQVVRLSVQTVRIVSGLPDYR